MPILELARLKAGFAGVHATRSSNHLHASLVCLTEQGHVSGVDLQLTGDDVASYQLIWDDTLDDQMRRTWRDLQEATEWGATALAFLLILERTDFTIIDRSRKGTGFDYWLGLRDEADKLVFRRQARLEVSGIMEAANVGIIQQRVREKVKQTTRSEETELPAYIVVVEFKTPQAHMVKI